MTSDSEGGDPVVKRIVAKLYGDDDDEVRAVTYTGRDPGNTDTEFMITVWPDGTATIAYRDEYHGTWGPDVELDRQEDQ